MKWTGYQAWLLQLPDVILHPSQFAPHQLQHPVAGGLAHLVQEPRLLLFEQMKLGDPGPLFWSGHVDFVEVPVVGVMDARFHILTFPTTGHDFIIDPLRCRCAGSLAAHHVGVGTSERVSVLFQREMSQPGGAVRRLLRDHHLARSPLFSNLD